MTAPAQRIPSARELADAAIQAVEMPPGSAWERALAEARSHARLGLVGSSTAMRALRAEIRTAAAVPTTVLLQGETGTGKGVAAKAIHDESERRARPFVAVACAALAPSLLETELFGHERGAFTGATQRRAGRLERAHDGTLLLDEVAELAPGLQAKLLRALEERHFERVGGNEARPMTARVIAATNRDLQDEVRHGRFRRDLFYRLDVLRIRAPSLRERCEDLPELAAYLLERAGRKLGRSIPPPHPSFFEALRAHDWPGNVRELANRLEAILVSCPGLHLSASDLPHGWPPPAEAPVSASDQATGWRTNAESEPAERETLASLLEECGGNVARVARRWGKPRSTVRYKIQRYGLGSHIPRD